jgi:hypothetical protein
MSVVNLKNFKMAMMRPVFEDEDTQHMVEAAFEYYGPAERHT